MKKITLKHGVLFFYIFDGILLLLFIIGFLPFTKKNKVPSVPSALLNPNYESKVSAIKISAPNASISLKKGDEFWIGTSLASNGKYIWPADVQNITNLINSAKQIMTVQVKTEHLSSWKSLGVDDEQATCVTFYDDNRNILSQIFFGFKDSLSLKLYFRTWTKNTVYEGLSFIENLNKFGYYGIVRRHPDKSYLRFVFIVDSHREIVDPSTVIPIFKKFDNLRMKA